MNHSGEIRRCKRYRRANPPGAHVLVLLGTLLAATLVVWAPSLRLNALPQASPEAVTDRVTYNAGEQVALRLILPSPQEMRTLNSYLFSVRFAGDEKPLAEGLILGKQQHPGKAARSPLQYEPLWKVPLEARPGRYEIDLRVQDPKSRQVIQEYPGVCSFVVHRQVIQILSAAVTQPFYRSGDAIGCKVQIQNLADRPIAGLRVEFSERYWPWIVQQTQKVGTGIETLDNHLTLKPHQQATEVSSPNCAVAVTTGQPVIKQYAAVVWDRDRKDVYAIAFTPLVFINPPGVVGLRPYPGQYVYPSLGAVNTTSYRNFHPAPFGADAIQFDTQHTMFASGSKAKVRFSLTNPTDTPWRQVSVYAHLMSPEGIELASHSLMERAELNPHTAPLNQEVSFTLPKGGSGLYRIRARITDDAGNNVAAKDLELGVNPLPDSALIFCAHEDDDGTQMGFIRALVENHVSLRVVYFTSGDAGACDRYYQHSCGPAEALNYGPIRMQEARAALGHLGVAPENILFLGLPDGGSGKIWYEHPRTSAPYLAVLLASDHAPYEGLFRANLPYARDAVVEATEEIIKKFQPEVIFTVHPPAEGHIDHIVNNYFVVKALQELLRAGAISSNVEVRVDRIFNAKEHPTTPYRYEDHQFYVSGEVMALAQEAGWFYQSQGGNQAEGNLHTWSQIPRSEGYRKVLDWKDHEGWNEKE